MKYSLPILVGLMLLLGGGAFVAFAQEYSPLVTLPGVTESGTGVTMGAYLAGMMKFIVALAGVFAILMAIIGGVQYVASGITPNAKSDAKERITNAFIGLALILVSYLILYSINPALVSFNLTLPSIVSAPVITPTVTTRVITPTVTPPVITPTVTPPVITPTVTPPVITPTVTQPVITPTVTTRVDYEAGGDWPDDRSIRSLLSSASNNKIAYNRSPGCSKIGQSACTSIHGLSLNIQNNLIQLSKDCGDTCRIMITGGTEYWLHGDRSTKPPPQRNGHRPDGNSVDLGIGLNRALDDYIRGDRLASGLYKNEVKGTDCSAGRRYRVGTGLYVDEVYKGNPAHWHVCF